MLRENKAEGVYQRPVPTGALHGSSGRKRGRGGAGPADGHPPPTLTSQLSQAGPQGSSQVISWWALQQRGGSLICLEVSLGAASWELSLGWGGG